MPTEILASLHAFVDVVLISLPLAGIAVGASVFASILFTNRRD